MCYIFNAVLHHRCPECNIADTSSGVSCRSWTMCNVEIGVLCPSGLQPQAGHWILTKTGDKLCSNCEQAIQAEQQRTINMFPGSRMGGEDVRQARCEKARAQNLAMGEMDLNTNPDFTALMYPGTRNRDISADVTLSTTLQAPYTQEHLLQHFGHQALPARPPLNFGDFQGNHGIHIPDPLTDYDLPELPENPDFEAMMMDQDLTFAAPDAVLPTADNLEFESASDSDSELDVDLDAVLEERQDDVNNWLGGVNQEGVHPDPSEPVEDASPSSDESQVLNFGRIHSLER